MEDTSWLGSNASASEWASAGGSQGQPVNQDYGRPNSVSTNSNSGNGGNSQQDPSLYGRTASNMSGSSGYSASDYQQVSSSTVGRSVDRRLPRSSSSVYTGTVYGYQTAPAQIRRDNAGIIVANRAGDEETEDGRIRNREAATKIRDAWIYKQIRARQVSIILNEVMVSSFFAL